MEHWYCTSVVQILLILTPHFSFLFTAYTYIRFSPSYLEWAKTFRKGDYSVKNKSTAKVSVYWNLLKQIIEVSRKIDFTYPLHYSMSCIMLCFFCYSYLIYMLSFPSELLYRATCRLIAPLAPLIESRTCSSPPTPSPPSSPSPQPFICLCATTSYGTGRPAVLCVFMTTLKLSVVLWCLYLCYVP